jgi:succinate-semialdehyde dehydrogenase / glutarate-semialdehyde dehydrogenase
MEVVQRVEAHIDDVVKKSAKMAVGGKRRSAFGGTYFEPTLLTDVTTDVVITQEEMTFGPVAPLYRFKSEPEAIKITNDTPTLPSPACAPACGEG